MMRSASIRFVEALALGALAAGCSNPSVPSPEAYAGQTFSNLSISITPQVICVPGPCAPSISSYRAFGFSSGDPRTGPVTAINGLFVSAAGAQGTVNLRDYPGCGTVVGVPWSAARR
jgi:hypothetical protein